MFLSTLLLAGCLTNDDGDVEITDDTEDADDSGGEFDTDPSIERDPVCEEPSEVGCVDEIILDLSLHDDLVSEGEVENEQDGDDWVTVADASAGGMYEADQNPWLYLRFTEDGLQRVDIDDETALEEMTWHLAARRYIVRLNSGTSGPSCVGGAEVNRDYADVELADAEAAVFGIERFYDEDCTIVEDDSNLPGSIETVLGAWWEYGNCVETTDQAFVVQLDDGQFVKLLIEQYYKGDGQDECNDEGTTNNESGIYTFRWRFLD